MDLVKQAGIVDSIHDTLNDFVGQRIKVRANMGRSKIVENEGVLTQVHPRLFIMEVERKRGAKARHSFQYADILTGMVEAACGAMEILADEGFGFELRGVCVPIVPAACLFDLLIGEPVWPDKAMGAQAARQALAFDANKARLEIGSVGAGCGATINKTGDISEIKKGGFGYKGLRFGDLVVIACAAVNSLGDVVGAASSEIALDALCENAADNIPNASEPCSNTTLGVVLTNAKLDKAQATKVAQMTQDAYARAIVPAHTTNDGDTIFTLASGKVEADINAVGALACAAMEAAIRCAVINE